MCYENTYLLPFPHFFYCNILIFHCLLLTLYKHAPHATAHDITVSFSKLSQCLCQQTSGELCMPLLLFPCPIFRSLQVTHQSVLINQQLCKYFSHVREELVQCLLLWCMNVHILKKNCYQKKSNVCSGES